MAKKAESWSREQIESLYELAGQGDVDGVRGLIDSAGSGKLPDNTYPFSLQQLWDSCLRGGNMETYELLKGHGVNWNAVHEESLKSLWGEEFDGLLRCCVAETSNRDSNDIKKLLFAILDDGYRFVGSSLVTGLNETYAMFQDDIEVFEKLDKARFPLCPDDYPPDTYGHYEYVQFWQRLLESGHEGLAAFLMRRGYALPDELQQMAERAGIADTPVDDDCKPRKLVDIARVAVPRATFSELKSVNAVGSSNQLKDGSSLVDDNGVAIVPDKVKKLAKGAFSHNNILRAILIPPSLVEISKGALDDLPNLVAVAMYFPGDLESLALDEDVFSFGNVSAIGDWPWVLDGIDEYRFGSAMASVSISDARTGWVKDKRCAVSVDDGNSHFRSEDGMLLSKDGKELLYCPNVEDANGSDTLVVPEGVETIGPRALKSTSYSHVQLPQSLRKIGLQAFARMPLVDIEIPGGVVDYDVSGGFSPDGIFEFCEALGKVAICEGVEAVAPGMFKYCNNLLECSLPSSLKSIGDEAFHGCRNLELTVPDGALTIGSRAFGSGILSAVRSVSLPANLSDRNFAEICGQANGALVLRRVKDGDGYDLAVYLPDDNDEAEARGTLEALWASWSGCSIEKGLASQDEFFLSGKFKRFYTKIRIAIARLAAPANLSAEAEEKYRQYLDKNLSRAKMELNSYEGAPFLRLLKLVLGEYSESEPETTQSDGVAATGMQLSPLDFNLAAMWNIERDGEPNYVGTNGYVSAIASAILFAQDYVFFNPGEITWDGRRHGIAGMQFNIAQVGDVPILMNNHQTVLTGIADMLLNFENDEGLHVPISVIHPGLHDALRYEDLTPLTLFNLQACGRAMQISQVGEEDVYQVLYDTRLACGIPDFYNLVARLIWDMRAYNEIGGAFVVNFASAVNFDANQCLEQFDDTVSGAENRGAWSVSVSDLPQIAVPADSGEIIIPSKGVSERTGWHFVTYEPTLSPNHDAFDQMGVDVEAFENAVRSTIWEMPRDCSIEGSGYLDRNSHIESLAVGDPLILAADWQSPYHDDGMAIEVFDVQGRTLGLLSMYVSWEKGALACLLPHISASVGSVTPLSARRKNAKYALLDVHMEIDEGLYDEDEEKPVSWLFGEIDTVLAKRASERVLMSKGSVKLEDLQGAINVSQAVRSVGESDEYTGELPFALADQSAVSGGFTISSKGALGMASEAASAQPNDSEAKQAASEKAARERREAEEQVRREAEERAEREQKEAEEAARKEAEEIAKRRKRETEELERKKAEERRAVSKSAEAEIKAKLKEMSKDNQYIAPSKVELDRLHARAAELEEEKRGLGLFGNGARKKQIKAEIAEIESKLPALKQAAERESAEHSDEMAKKRTLVFREVSELAKQLEEGNLKSFLLTYDSISNASLGSTITFGKWELPSSRGENPLEWIVIGKEGSRVLLLTKYYVSYKPFHDTFRYITWSECSLRSWLNGDFFYSCFNNAEAEMIPLISLRTPDNPYQRVGRDQPTTKDRVFCLSLQEAQNIPKQYLEINDDNLTYLSYWLRTTGQQRPAAGGFCAIRNQASIDPGGEINASGWAVDNSSYGDVAVRPCIYVDLEIIPKSLI